MSELIQRLLLLINYEAHLKKSQKDWETRWENIQELVNFASSAIAPNEAENVDQQPSTNGRVAEEEVVDLVSDSEGEEQGQGGSRYLYANQVRLTTLLKRGMLVKLL